MILLLNTSTPLCRVTLIDGERRIEAEWQADRQLAKGLLGYLKTQLSEQGKTWQDLEGIGVFQGPGSFTGLRIGITVLNTIADSESIPIVGGTGEEWQTRVLDKLQNGEDEKIVLPIYGGEANITKPRK